MGLHVLLQELKKDVGSWLAMHGYLFWNDKNTFIIKDLPFC